MDNRKIVEAWHKIEAKVGVVGLPQFYADDFTDDEIIAIIRLMRSRIKWAESHPCEDDPYEALGEDYQNFYMGIQRLADYREIVVDDESDVLGNEVK